MEKKKKLECPVVSIMAIAVPPGIIIFSLMQPTCPDGCPPTAVDYPPTAVDYPPIATGYPPRFFFTKQKSTKT